MTFGVPAALGALALVPPVALLVRWAARRRARDTARLGNPALIARLGAGVDPARDRWADRLRLAALACLVVAAARPQWGSRSETVTQRGLQVMVALDVSDSMLAEDIKPNRLARAKLEIAGLMDRLGGDEIGLVLFAGAAFVQSPLTSDYAVARTFLDAARAGVISLPGTAVADAIRAAMTGFDTARSGQKVIVVISDGEDRESDAEAAAAEADAAGIVVFTIGMGSPEGAPIPVFGPTGELAGVKRDSAGQVVLTRLDDGVLTAVAERTGGTYIRAGAGGFERLAEALDGLQRGTYASRRETLRVERFQIFAALAVVLLLGGELLTGRRRTPRDAAGTSPGRAPEAPPAPAGREAEESPGHPAMPARPASSPTLTAMAMAGLAMAGVACGSSPADHNAAGNRAYATQDWAAAAAAYATAAAAAPERAEPAYNLANAAFRQADVAAARGQLHAALALDDGRLAQAIWYNLGHVAYNEGDYRRAAEDFKAALRLDPSDADAKHNLELALRQLDQRAESSETETPDPSTQPTGQPSAAPGSPTPGAGGQTPPAAGTPGNRGTQTADASPSSGSGTPSPPASTSTGSPQQAGGQPSPSAGAGGNGTSPGEAPPPAGDGRPQRGLSPVEARRLLQALGRNTRTLQEVLQQRFVIPGRRAPSQDW